MKTKICIPIVENKIEDAITAIQSADSKADIIELRIDFLEEVDERRLAKLIDTAEKPLIFTCRLKNQGGTGNITEENRKELLTVAMDKRVDFIDLEFTSDTIISGTQATKIITSHHDFDKTPESNEIKSIIRQLKTKSGALVKYIPTANSINDNFKIFKMLQENENIISFCMGLKGHISRVLAGKYGSAITFAADSPDKQSAPGQVDFDELTRGYNFLDIDKNTKVYGVFGQFAENSKSKYMHNPVFRRYNINAVYLPFKIEPGKDLEIFVENFRKFEFSGASVTIPHKGAVMEFLDKVDNTAKAIGAVNTIKLQDGKLIGYNTDCVGAINTLKEKADLKDKKVLVIGAGGAARAIVYGLKREQAKVTIINRTFEKAQNLAAEFTADVMKMDIMAEHLDEFDIFINTTSVGMHPKVDATVLDSFPENRVVMDIVYKPLKTKFLKMAEKCNCEIITGEKMLIQQAIVQQKIWTGIKPDFEFMSKSFFEMEE